MQLSAARHGMDLLLQPIFWLSFWATKYVTRKFGTIWGRCRHLNAGQPVVAISCSSKNPARRGAERPPFLPHHPSWARQYGAVICVLATAFGFAVPVPTRAGNGRPAERRERIYFSALNKEEKPALALADQDFSLRVNGGPAPLEDFRPGLPYTDKSIPLIAWILIDFNPNIDANLISRQSRAAGEIFSLLHPNSAVGVKIVSDRSETLAPLGHEPAALREAFLSFSQKRTELRVGAHDAEVVGTGGLLRAMDLVIDEMDRHLESEPALQGRELHRAIMIISDGNINPSYNKKPLYEKAARANVFFYPVFVPRQRYGLWVEDYLDLAKRSGGVASVLGALSPGSKILPLPRSSSSANALTFNFIHMIRDLNGKYSFAVPLPAAGEAKVDLRCRRKGIASRIPRTNLP